MVDQTKIPSCSLTESKEEISLQLGDAKIVLKLQSDITTQTTDFIVNAANEKMLGGGGVDGVISAKGGKELLLFRQLAPEVRPGVRCPVGEAKVTDSGLLPSLFCIHAVGPRFDPWEKEKCRAQLCGAYENTIKAAHALIDAAASEEKRSFNLSQAKKTKASLNVIQNAERLQTFHWNQWKAKISNNEPVSISFPTISTGIFGYPKEEGARLSIESIVKYIENTQGKTGIKVFQFVFIDQQPDLPYYRDLFNTIAKSFSK